MFVITGINYSTGEVTVCPLVEITSKKGEKLSFLQKDRQLKQVVPQDQLKSLKVGQPVKMSINI